MQQRGPGSVGNSVVGSTTFTPVDPEDPLFRSRAVIVAIPVAVLEALAKPVTGLIVVMALFDDHIKAFVTSCDVPSL